MLDRTKEPGAVGEPLFLDTVAAVTEASADGERRLMPRIVGGRYGLSSKEFTPGMVAGVFAELAAERPRRRFTVGIVDDVSGTSLDYDPMLDIEPTTRLARSSSAWARTAPSGRTRTRSRSWAPRRACTRRATSSTTRRSPARRRCRTCASGHVRSGRRTSSAGGLRGLPPVRPARPRRRARPRGGRRDPAAQLPVHPPEAVWDALSRPVQEQILAKRHRSPCRRCRPDRARGGPAGTHQHRPPDLLLRALRRAAAEQAIERIKAAIARRTAGGGQRWSSATRRRSTARSPGCTGRGARAGHRRSVRCRCRARRRARVRPHGHRGDAGRAGRRPAGQRAARGRDLSERHGGVREAQHLRPRRGVGRRPLHPVRQLQLRLPPQRDPLEVLRRVAPRRGAGRLRVRAARRRRACRMPASRSRSTSRTAPAAGCASRPARSSAPADPGHKAINLAAARAAARARAREHRVLRDPSGNRAVAGRLRHRARDPVPGTAVRVLGRVRRLRRDAVRQAALAAVRRPADGRQRDRLLVDLRRQPAHHAMDDQCRRAGPAWSNSLFEDNAEFGLGFRLAADRHTKLARRRLGELRDAVGAELVDEILERRSCESPSCARSAHGWAS